MPKAARLFIAALCVSSLGCGLPSFDDESGAYESEDRCPPPQIVPLDPTLPRQKVEDSDASLRVAQSCDDVARWAVKHYTEVWLKDYYHHEFYYCHVPSENTVNNVNGGWEQQDMSAPPSPDLGGSVDPTTPAGPDDYSMTNVQDRGVDEPDSIKTNGRHIYAVHDEGIKVFKSWPVEEAAELATIPLEWNGSLSIMLSGDKLIAIVRGTRSEIMVYDVSTPAAPRMSQRIVLPGEASHVRMIKGRIHLVMQSQWRDDDKLGWELVQRAVPQSTHSVNDDTKERVEQSRHRIYADIDAITASIDVRQQLPVALSGLPNEPLIPLPLYDDCAGNILLNDALPANPQLISLVSMDVTDLSDIKTTGALLDPELFYTSANALYIAADGDTPYHALSYPRDGTQLYAFDLSREDAATYSGHGVVAGEILPDLAMSEYAGHLRVFANAAGETQLTIFKAMDGVLELVGGLANIAPGERATAARMSGDRLYVLTAKGSGITSPALPIEHPDFRPLNDPLFVIDAADPTDPKLLGQLDFPGFSAYVHLIGRDHLLSLGRDEQLRLRLQLFDVTDTSAPKTLYEYTVDKPGHIHNSLAQDSRMSFVYHAARGLLALPVVEQSLETRQTTFNGQMLFDASLDGIAPIGQLDHATLSSDSCVAPCDPPSINASLFIEDYLYSFSPRGFMIHDAGARPVTSVRGVAYSR